MSSRILVPLHAADRNPELPGPPIVVGNSSSQPWVPERVKPELGTQLAALDLAGLGVEVRWLGDQTDACLAALEPSRYHGRGADELARFRAGARARADVAVSVHTLFDDESPRSVMFSAVASVSVSDYTSVSARRVGAGTLPVLADGLDAPDRDLANRLLQTIGAGNRWLALSLNGAELHTPSGYEVHQPVGTLTPLLVTQLGEPVAAVWIDDEGLERVYVLPEGHDWAQTIRWLVERCLPVHASNGLRALRRDLVGVPVELLSDLERDANAALAELEAEYEPRLADARQAATAARLRADEVRDGLLYETGAPLVAAVAGVLGDAGLSVEDLDERFGNTVSADLLVTDAVRVLVEVKSSNQSAGEDLAIKLTKHLATWPKILPDEPVDRGVLVVNHQLRVPVEQRNARVYTNQAFVDTLDFEVVSTRDLLTWWLRRDWVTIRRVFGGGTAETSSASGSAGEVAPRRRRFRSSR